MNLGGWATSAPHRNAVLLHELRDTMREVIGMSRANPVWWRAHINGQRAVLVNTFLDWHRNDRLPDNYTDQRGWIALRYLRMVLERFYRNPSALMPVEQGRIQIDPDAMRLRPRGPINIQPGKENQP